jgi:hypothetical protein
MPNGFLLTGEAIKKLRADHITLKNLVRRLESMVSNIRPNLAREDSVLVKVTEEIEGRTTTTLGKGKADIQNIDLDTENIATYSDATEVKTAGAAPTNRNIDVYNDSLIPIPLDSIIRVSRNYRSAAWMPDMETQTAIAKTSLGINARVDVTSEGVTTSAPGSATVTIYYINSTGNLEDTENTVTAYNLAGAAIAANAWITIKRVEGSNFWVVDMEDCGPE